MAKLVLFFVLSGFFSSFHFYAQTEKQLRSELSIQKDKTSQLNIRLRILDIIYERDRNEWQNEVAILIEQRLAYPGKNNQSLISLLEAERAFYLGNTESLAAIFDQQLMKYTFKNANLEWRKNILGLAVHPNNEAFDYQALRTKYSNRQNKREQATLYLQIARNFTSNDQKDSAIWASNIALQLAKRADKKWVLIEAMQQQAEVYWHFNLFELAVQRAINSLQLAEEAQLEYFKVKPLLLIASICIEVKSFNQALSYLKRSNEIAQQRKDEFQLALVEYFYGHYYLGVKDEKKAELVALSALQYFEKVGNRSYINNAKLLKLVANQDNVNNSENLFNSLIASLKPSKDALYEAELLFEYGNFLLSTSQFQKAKDAFQKSLNKLPSESLIRPKIANAYRSLAVISSKMGQSEQAYNYQQKYSNWLVNSPVWRSAARIEEMAAANLREERERLIENQQASIERAEKERKIVELQRDRQLFISIIFIVAIIFGVIIFVLRVQQGKIKQDQREAELSQTLLRTQMNPHFVFNAMSVIQSYIFENDPKKSSQFLVNFSRLMRLILENSPKEFIPIELEYEILDKYLNAQKMRFENRFEYALNISEELLLNKAVVSPMITQPFIENSIEHGQLHTIEGGKIVVDFKAKDGKLEIQITDNGVGRNKSAKTKKIKSHKSMAIDITRERISILNKKHKFNGSLSIRDLDEKKKIGTSVILILPLKFDSEI